MSSVEEVATLDDLDRRLRQLPELIAAEEQAMKTAGTLEGIQAARRRLQDLRDEVELGRARRSSLAAHETQERIRAAAELQAAQEAAVASLAVDAAPIVAELAKLLEDLAALRLAAVTAGAPPAFAPDRFEAAQPPAVPEPWSILHMADALAWHIAASWPTAVAPEAKRRGWGRGR